MGVGGIGVAVGTAVGVGTGVAVGVDVWVGVGARVGVTVGVGTGVAVGADVGVSVGGTVGVTVGAANGVGVGGAVGAGVGDGMLVGVGAAAGIGVVLAGAGGGSSPQAESVVASPNITVSVRTIFSIARSFYTSPCGWQFCAHAAAAGGVGLSQVFHTRRARRNKTVIPATTGMQGWGCGVIPSAEWRLYRPLLLPRTGCGGQATAYLLGG